MKRTQFLHLLPAAGLSLLLLGCGEKTTADRQLNLYAWSEYVPSEVLEGFTRQTGIKVNYSDYDSNETMIENLEKKPSAYDLVQPSEYYIQPMVEKGLLAPLDKKKLPNLRNIAREFRGLPYDKENNFSVPYMSGTVGIVVNTEKAKMINSYAELFSGHFKGRIVALDDSRQMVSWALAASGKSINDITPENLQKVKPLIADWVKQIKIYDSDSPKDALLSGEVDLGLVWSGEAAILINENRKFQFDIPSEGGHRFVDSLCITAQSPHKAEAHEFINYILRPDVSAKISAAFPYTNPNSEARKLLRSDQLNNVASYLPPGKKLSTMVPIGDLAKDVDDLYAELKPPLEEEKKETPEQAKEEPPKTAAK